MLSVARYFSYHGLSVDDVRRMVRPLRDGESLLLVGSVAVDALVGGGRVAALTNTAIPNAAGQSVAAYVARPPGEGPFPAVIMLHEFWGLKEEIAGKADALAEQGYVVVAPDMYRGQTTDWLLRAIYLDLTVPEAQALGDLDPVFDWLQEQPNVDPDRIVVMGFCYGGGKALQYSLRNPELAATGVFYGSLERDPAVLGQLPGPVLGAAEGDDDGDAAALGPAVALDCVGKAALVAAGVGRWGVAASSSPVSFPTVQITAKAGPRRCVRPKARASLSA